MINMDQHNGGDLHFGKDDYLYITVGDGGCDYAGDSGCAGQKDASRDSHILLGKVLRITRDGGIPATNPYTGTDSARCNLTGRTDPGKKCQETFASGLRNPFRFAFDPNASGTRFFINDVG
jgi:glucose/arabinose dehydrogenase